MNGTESEQSEGGNASKAKSDVQPLVMPISSFHYASALELSAFAAVAMNAGSFYGSRSRRTLPSKGKNHRANPAKKAARKRRQLSKRRNQY